MNTEIDRQVHCLVFNFQLRSFRASCASHPVLSGQLLPLLCFDTDAQDTAVLSHILALSYTAVTAGSMLMLLPCRESAGAGHRLQQVQFGTEQFLLVWFGTLWFGCCSRGKRGPRRC